MYPVSTVGRRPPERPSPQLGPYSSSVPLVTHPSSCHSRLASGWSPHGARLPRVWPPLHGTAPGIPLGPSCHLAGTRKGLGRHSGLPARAIALLVWQIWACRAGAINPSQLEPLAGWRWLPSPRFVPESLCFCTLLPGAQIRELDIILEKAFSLTPTSRWSWSLVAHSVS